MRADRREAWLCSLLAVLLLAGCRTARPTASAPREPVAPALWGSLDAGPWAVGLRVQPVGALQLTVWYPARPEETSGPRPRYRDYVGLSGSEQRPEAWEDPAVAARAVSGYQRLLTEN